MKKLLLILLFFPFIGFGQTYEVKTTYDPLMNSSKSTINKKVSPYGTKKYKPDIKPFVPDYNSFERAIKNRVTEQSRINKNAKRMNDLVKSWNNKYNSRNNAASLDHANLIRNYHKSLTTSTLLPKPTENAPEKMSSDVFLIIKDPSSDGGLLNSKGTQVYSASAYYSFNKQLKAYEIFNIYIKDPSFNNPNIFKRNHEWDYENKIKKLMGANNVCPTTNYFISPLVINAEGKCIGKYTGEMFCGHSGCMKLFSENPLDLLPIEVYFIKDLEKFSKEQKP